LPRHARPCRPEQGAQGAHPFRSPCVGLFATTNFNIDGYVDSIAVQPIETRRKSHWFIDLRYFQSGFFLLLFAGGVTWCVIENKGRILGMKAGFIEKKGRILEMKAGVTETIPAQVTSG
jgi:hypothetical protein